MNRINLFLIFISTLFGFTGCLEEFKPPIKSSETNKYVISGTIINQEGFQTVSVSKVSSIRNPHYRPVEDCSVTIYDDKGNSYPHNFYDEGKYWIWMFDDDQEVGNSYRVEIITPEGIEIISDYDKMNPCPEIDSVYYIREDMPTRDPELTYDGIQFYLDLDAENTTSKYFMWEIEETWEYHAEYPNYGYFDGWLNILDSPDSSKQICWSTQKINKIFTLSLDNTDTTVYKKLPLNYVKNRTSRLTHCYSILVKQQALSKEAYTYWDQMAANNNTEPNLYQKQPLSVKGNLKSTSHPEIEILGFFSATSIKTKRFFVKKIEDMEIVYNTFCAGPQDIDDGGLASYLPSVYPIYLIEIEGGLKILNKACVDCRVLGGVPVRPYYWPK